MLLIRCSLLMSTTYFNNHSFHLQDLVSASTHHRQGSTIEPGWVLKGCMGVEFNQLGVHLLSQIVSYSTVVSQIIWGSYQAFLFMKILHATTPMSVTLCTCFCVQACACLLEILFTISINN